MTVNLSTVDGLATITLARPSAHNALDVETKVAFLDVVTTVDANASVRAVLITAEGKNFCVGQDLGEHVESLRADPSTAMETVDVHYNPLIRALAGITVPIVVAISGACVGAGFGIALAGDIRVAGERTSFATAFTGIALGADSGLSHHLVSKLGASRAAGLMMLGDKVTAAQALDWGLVHRVVDDGEVLATATELASRLAHGPTQAFIDVKSMINASDDGLDAALDRELASQRRLGQTADHAAAVSAFLAKEKPVFTGH